MKKTFLILSIFLLVQTTYCFGQTNAVYFETGSYKLTNETKKTLDAVYLEIKKAPKVEQMAIMGYTDSDGSAKANEILSLNRAREVKKYLENKGLKNRISLFAKGEIASENAAGKAGKLQNRRVEIVQNYSTNNDAFKQFEQKFQTFVITTDKDTTLTCEKGSKIKILKNSFEGINSSQKVTIKVQEFYTKASFITANLSSMTKDGKLLESRGMLNIEAYQKDKKLKLKQGKSIGIEFKDRKKGDKTQLFNGLKQNNEIVWLLNGISNSNINRISDDSIRIVSFEKKGMEIKETYALGMHHIIFRRKVGSKEISKSELKDAFYDSLGNRIFFFHKKEDINSTLTSRKLDWINCDRFYNTDVPKVDLIVEYEGDFVPSVALVFKDINSVLLASYSDGHKIVFKNIPIDMDVEFVGMFKPKDKERTYFAKLGGKTKKNFNKKLEFELLDKEQIQERVSML